MTENDRIRTDPNDNDNEAQNHDDDETNGDDVSIIFSLYLNIFNEAASP